MTRPARPSREPIAEFVAAAEGKATTGTFRPGVTFGRYLAGAGDVQVTLSREGIIEGTCTDATSGAPVPGIAVIAAPEKYSGDPFAARQVATAEDGSFRTGGLAPGTYTLKAKPSAEDVSWSAARPV
ncbi:MAG: carboxypeptidase-like regulatory domain-containing protein, partial [Planctomycetota bacterium]